MTTAAAKVHIQARPECALDLFCDAALRARRIEVGEPEVLMSNLLRGWRSFSASFA
jgi:hypothetical protein